MTVDSLDRIIVMAWEDRTPFQAIDFQFSLNDAEIIQLMRNNLTSSYFRLWRKILHSGTSSKHKKKRNQSINRFKCSRQRSISNNKISKR